jgi:hypothetical protein
MNQSRHLAIGLLTLLALAACGGGHDDVPQERFFSRIEAPWAYTTLSADYVSATAADWNVTWHLHEPRWIPARAPVSVDFASDMVLGLTRGTGSSGCDTLTIKRVLETSQRLQVEYVRAVPLQLQGCSGNLTPLTDFVITAKSLKPVVFVQTDA